MDENMWSNDLDSDLFSGQVYERKLNVFMKPLVKIQAKWLWHLRTFHWELKKNLFALI